MSREGPLVADINLCGSELGCWRLCLRQKEPWESSRIPDVWSQSFHHSSELLSVRLSPPDLGSSLASPALIVKIPLWPVAAINSDFCACWAAE